MTIEFTNPGAYLECDVAGCDASMEWTEWIEFPDILQEMKDAGWISRKVAGEWEHTCPDCQAGSK